MSKLYSPLVTLILVVLCLVLILELYQTTIDYLWLSRDNPGKSTISLKFNILLLVNPRKSNQLKNTATYFIILCNKN